MIGEKNCGVNQGLHQCTGRNDSFCFFFTGQSAICCAGIKYYG